MSRGQSPELIDRLRALCMALPEATEKLSHGEAAWFVRDKKQFVMTSDHHHDDRIGAWCAAPPGAQEALIASSPDRYFRPPYVGHRGWVGIYLDVPNIDWEEVKAIVEDAYRCSAPANLQKLL